MWATSLLLSTQAVPGGAGGCFARSWGKPPEASVPQPPQIQNWHAHNSLHCGEGSSPERQLLGIAIQSLLPYTLCQAQSQGLVP